jgi:NarL family two-component system response regulator LiaR
MSMQKNIRVLLVDDHPMVRKGMELFLTSSQLFDVVGQAGNGHEAIELAAALKPDVICMDIVMSGMDGIIATEQLKVLLPAVEILAVTSYIDLEKILAAIQAGVSGYVMKDASPAELIRAIQTVARGEIYLHPEATRKLARHFEPSAKARPLNEILTQREREVIQLVTRGLNNQDIAGKLGIGLKTVKTHVSNILEKLELENRVQIAIYALQNHIISLDDL